MAIQEAGHYSPDAQARFYGTPSVDIVNGALERIRAEITRTTQSFLAGHEDLLKGEDAIDELVRRKVAERVTGSLENQNHNRNTGDINFLTYVEGRLGGLFNDPQSIKPGVIAYVTEKGLAKYKKVNPDVADRQIQQLAANIWEIQLPKGYFVDADYGYRVFIGQEPEHPESFWNNGTGFGNTKSHFGMEDELIRIIGTGGGNELLQSPFFHYDGTPRVVESSVQL